MASRSYRGTTRPAVGSTAFHYHKHTFLLAHQNVGDDRKALAGHCYLKNKVPGSDTRFTYHCRDILHLSVLDEKAPIRSLVILSFGCPCIRSGDGRFLLSICFQPAAWPFICNQQDVLQGVSIFGSVFSDQFSVSLGPPPLFTYWPQLIFEFLRRWPAGRFLC